MLAIKTILHPTDFSEQSECAFHLACALAHDYGAQLIILHVVVEPLIIAGDGIPMLPPDQEINMIRSEIDKIRPQGVEIKVERVITKGDPTSEILRITKDYGCDIIILGTHGRSGLTRFIMGSVAEEVIRKATCPVVTIKAATITTSLPVEHSKDEAVIVS